MKPFLGVALAIIFVASAGNPARADDKDTNAVLDRAIKAVGGEEKLKTIEAMSWKTKATISINGDSNPLSSQSTAKGTDHYRMEFEAEFGGNAFKGAVVVADKKGWRKFGDQSMEMDEDMLTNEKLQLALNVVPVKLVLLKEKGYKLESAAEQKIGDKPALGIKVTCPSGKDFTIYFDKESALPVRTVAKVLGFDGQEFTMETNLSDYKEFDGIKKATKSESKRDGEEFIKGEISDFKVLDKVDPKTFAEPE